MKDTQIPEKVPAAGAPPASSGRHRSGALAVAACLALAGVTAWLPAASAWAGQAGRIASASRTAGLAQAPGLLASRLTSQGLAHPLGQTG